MKQPLFFSSSYPSSSSFSTLTLQLSGADKQKREDKRGWRRRLIEIDEQEEAPFLSYGDGRMWLWYNDFDFIIKVLGVQDKYN